MGVHVSVCICTYRRPEMLSRLLHHLTSMRTAELFSYSVIVVDNDTLGLAEAVTATHQAKSDLALGYIREHKQNIAVARNAAIENAEGDYIAFIDDDEIPTSDWLLHLFRSVHETHWSGCLGPVRPIYPVSCPKWVTRGGFHSHREPRDGAPLSWTDCRTGNVLFRSNLFSQAGFRFDAVYGSGGEDRDLFRRLIESGYKFTWNGDAVVHETVPLYRCRRLFLLRRGLLRGTAALSVRRMVLPRAVRSLAAVTLYIILLPFMYALGEHRFMHYAVSCADHLGLLLQACGWRVVRENYLS